MDRKEIILLLMSGSPNSIVGTTRLQKLLFLTEKELGIEPENNGFNFEPYKYGPASKELYNDLEFLSSIGYIQRSNDKYTLNDLDINNLENYSADLFLSDFSLKSDPTSMGVEDSEDAIPDDENDAVVYRITEAGIKYLSDNGILDIEQSASINDLAVKYSNYSLTSLLQYVYRNYPDYTIESEIKDRL